jgi:2-dehydropantoate 2-reductase
MRKGTPQASLPIITEYGGIRSEQQIPVVTPNSHAPISHLVITTKAYDVSEAVASIAHLLSEDSVVVLLVNGMGLAEQVAADWPHLNIFCGTTTEGAYCLAPQHIQHTGRGQTRIGKQGEKKPPPWFDQWSDAIDTCLWDSDIEAALWSKMAINCIINPLTALHNCANGELSQRPELITQVTTLCGEVSKITRAAGFAAIAAALPQLVAGVIAATANNRSSMLQDVEKGRRTEIDYITGFLLRVADQHGIDAPQNRALLKSIKSHEC